MAKAKDDTKPVERPEKENVFEARYLGSGTFRITKPRRKLAKQRLARVRNPRRRARRG